MTFSRSAARYVKLALALLLVPVSSLAQGEGDGTHIVFLVGPKDHGFAGRHEYEKDLRVLANALERAPNLRNIRTSVFVGKAPRDLSLIADADVFVIESSSDRAANETHPLFPPDPETDHRNYDAETQAYLDAFDALVKAGAGVVLLHYTTWAEHWDARDYYLKWTGGLWVQIGSKNPVDEWQIDLIDRTHPVLRGVKPWTYRDEIFTRFFLPNDFRRTDLLLGTPQQDRNGIGPQVVAWAYQRDDGGRGFVFGGVDYHDNMLIDDYRRFLLNGIVWAAGVDVPAGGVQSEKPEGIEPFVQPAPPRRP